MGRSTPRHVGPSRLTKLRRAVREGRFEWRMAWEVALARLPPFTQRTTVTVVAVLVTSLALIGGLVALLPPPTMTPDPDQPATQDRLLPSTTRPHSPTTAATPADQRSGRSRVAGAGGAPSSGPQAAAGLASTPLSARRAGPGRRPAPATSPPATSSSSTVPAPSTSKPTPAPTTTTRRELLPPVTVPPVSLPLLP